jgi:uncharacterized protein YkwD
MTKTFFALLGIVAILLLQPVAHAQKATDNKMAAEVLQLINEHRAELKLPPLKMNLVVTAIAASHSANMASGKVPFSHDGFDDRVAMINKQIKTANAWAENVAEGPRTAKSVVDMWLHSPEHKKNIEGHYDLTGIAISKSADGSMYYTELFVNMGK